MAEESPRAEEMMEEAQADSAEAAEEVRPESVFCSQCGAAMTGEQRFCSTCGWDAEHPETPPPGRPAGAAKSPRDLGPLSPYNRLTVLLLTIVLGWLGVHRFYVGRPLSGIAWLLTIGFLGVGVIYDLILIATGEFRDGEQRRIWHWN